jgi:hypothetical protein
MSLVPVGPAWTDVVAPSLQLAERIAGTEFVPKALRDRPEAVLACILTGHEVGVGPMAALAKIHVVEGRPTMAAELMRALGLSAGHEAWVDEATNTRVTVAGRRQGSNHVHKVTWTLDDARKAGLAGKQNWQRYPRQMLLARATAELARLVWPDVLGGIAYATEELEDGDGPPAEPSVAEASPAPAKRQRRALAERPAPAVAPSLPPVAHHVGPSLPPLPGEEPSPSAGDDASAPPADDTSPPITAAQRRKLHAVLHEIGVDSREDRLSLASGFVGRELASSNELTPAEYSAFIDAAEAVGHGQAELVADDDAHLVGIRPNSDGARE